MLNVFVILQIELLITMFKTTTQNILLLDIISAILMLISFLFLLIGFFALNSLGLIQEASGAADWVKWIFLTGSIICFIFLFFYIFCAINWFTLRTKGKWSIIAELIYILGIYNKEKARQKREEEVKKSIGGDIITPKSKAASVESLYGFGHTEDERWTFSGKKPKAPNSI